MRRAGERQPDGVKVVLDFSRRRPQADRRKNVHGATYEYQSAIDAMLTPARVTTTTWTLPGGCAGARAFSSLVDITWKRAAAVAPKSTAVTRAKPSPCTATQFPPLEAPRAGLTLPTTIMKVTMPLDAVTTGPAGRGAGTAGLCFEG